MCTHSVSSRGKIHILDQKFTIGHIGVNLLSPLYLDEFKFGALKTDLGLRSPTCLPFFTDYVRSPIDGSKYKMKPTSKNL